MTKSSSVRLSTPTDSRGDCTRRTSSHLWTGTGCAIPTTLRKMLAQCCSIGSSIKPHHDAAVIREDPIWLASFRTLDGAANRQAREFIGEALPNPARHFLAKA